MSEPGVVDFDYDDWKKRFPAVSETVMPEQAEQYFEEACILLKNTPASPVRNLGKRRTLLYLLVAHLAQLGINANAGQGSGNGGMVGRISSATRGSVSIGTDSLNLPGTAGWYTQTQWGATFWSMTTWLRQMRLLPGRPHPARIWP